MSFTQLIHNDEKLRHELINPFRHYERIVQGEILEDFTLQLSFNFRN